MAPATTVKLRESIGGFSAADLLEAALRQGSDGKQAAAPAENSTDADEVVEAEPGSSPASNAGSWELV